MPAIVDDVLPVLTSRFLAFREDDATREQEPQQEHDECFKLPTNLLEDDTTSIPMVVSPGNSRTGKDVALLLPPPDRHRVDCSSRRLSCPPRVLPTTMIPTTPIPAAGRYRALDLFASFSSLPNAEAGVWAAASSPGTTCAVRGGALESKSNSNSNTWLPPPVPRLQAAAQLPPSSSPKTPAAAPLFSFPARDPEKLMTSIPASNSPGFSPTGNRHHPSHGRNSLLPPSTPSGRQRDNNEFVPPVAFVVCGNDDEISVLADNPDDEDGGEDGFALPHVTYGVLANVLDQM